MVTRSLNDKTKEELYDFDEVEAEVENTLQAVNQDKYVEVIVEAEVENTLQAVNQDKYVHVRRPQRFVMFSNFWQFGKTP